MKYIIIISAVFIMILTEMAFSGEESDDNKSVKHEFKMTIYPCADKPIEKTEYTLYVDVENKGTIPFMIGKKGQSSLGSFPDLPSMPASRPSASSGKTDTGMVRVFILPPGHSAGVGEGRIEIHPVIVKPGENMLVKVQVNPEKFFMPGKYRYQAKLSFTHGDYQLSEIYELECLPASTTQPVTQASK
jgi:hypothetical protein